MQQYLCQSFVQLTQCHIIPPAINSYTMKETDSSMKFQVSENFQLFILHLVTVRVSSSDTQSSSVQTVYGISEKRRRYNSLHTMLQEKCHL